MGLLRRLLGLRRLLLPKGEATCTLLLLLLLSLLLYLHQVVLWTGGDAQLHASISSTSSSRSLLGTGGGAVEGPPGPPPCRAQDQPSRPQPNVRPRARKRRRGGATATPPQRPPAFDFSAYVRDKDKRHFRLILDQPHKCGPNGSAPPHLLIAVKSVAADFDKRQVVRATWGREGLAGDARSIRTIFLLGVPKNRSGFPLWDRLLAHESRRFGDVLLWDFEDTFFNLTLKETHFLKWVNSSCPGVSFIFKGDADVYVNVENILEMLQGQEAEAHLFVGDIIASARPIRRRSSKYYVPEFIYGAALYPDYAGGGGFVMSGFTARRLSSACEQVELFPIDDVFLGMCLQLMGLKPRRHQGFRTFGIPRPSAAPHLQTFEPCFYRELMVVHGLSAAQIWLMWTLLHDPGLRCHSRGGAAGRAFAWRRPARGPAHYAEREVFVPR